MRYRVWSLLLAAALLAPETVAAGEDGADRRTLGRFGSNLARSAVGVVSSRSLLSLGLGGALFAGTSLLDDEAQRAFASRFPGPGQFGATLGRMAVVSGLTGGLFAVGQAHGGRLEAATYDLAQAVIVNAAYTGALKQVVGRTRPDGSDRLSFPSGHTSNAFATATVVSHHYGPKLGVPAFAVAGFVGLSRVERSRHHLSDVAFGAALGVVVGRTVVRLNSEPLAGARGAEIRLLPLADSRGTLSGLAVSASF